MITAALVLMVLSQSPDAGGRRACAQGVRIKVVDAGPHEAKVSVREASALAERAASRRKLRLLGAAAADAPELVIKLQVQRREDEVYFAVRSELIEFKPDAVVVWQSDPLSDAPTLATERQVLSAAIAKVAAAAANECR